MSWLFGALAAAGAISRALLPAAIVAAGCFLHGTLNASGVEVIGGSHEPKAVVAAAERGPTDIPVTFTASELVVQEPLGIIHPDQVIDFDRRIEAAQFHLVDADGAVVHHQLLSGDRLAVRIRGGLRPNETRRFRIVPGAASGAPVDDIDALRVTETTNQYEIANPLVAVRVPKMISPGHALAPIQAVRLRNGNWVGSALSPGMMVDLQGQPITIKAGQLTFIERGPLVATVEISYTVERPPLVYGSTVLVPADEGFYRATITLQAAQPSILIEEDTNIDMRWELELDALKADQARYQGHHATSADNGSEVDGRQYRASHERPNMDAFVDLPFRQSSGYGRFLTRWDPWAFDTGWYWQFYEKSGAASSNLLGIFQGRASRILGAHFSGVMVRSEKKDELRLVSQASRRGPDAKVFARNRYSWGLFSGTKDDLREPTAVQPVAQQMNLHAGVNLNKLHRYVLDPPASAAEAQGLYLDRDTLVRMIREVRADTGGPHGRGYYGHLYRADPTLRPLWEAWADRSGKKARELADAIIGRSRTVMDSFVNGQGIYAFEYQYWHGGLAMTRDAVAIAHLLAYSEFEPAQLPPDMRARLRSIAAMYAYLLWDDDFVPLFEHGQNLGTPNMPVQQISYRDLLALMLAQHPYFATKVAGVRARAASLLAQSVNEQGAALGSSHYLQASMGPILNIMQQRKRGAEPDEDPFRTEPRLPKFADFLLHLLTPPEPRFGGRRKVVSFGDGSTEATELYGQLGTAFRGVNDELSERLMGAWRQSGAPHSGFFGSSVLRIDERLPEQSPMLGDANFPGALTVLRHGFGTPDETAAWLINGDFYRDHYHCDLGAVMLYALGSPISVHWGSLYQPRVAGAWMQNVVVPEARLGTPWDSADVSLDDCFANRTQIIREAGLNSEAPSASAVASFDNRGALWTRRVWDYRSEPGAPVLRIRDKFEGPGASDPKIFSLTLMATGPVTTEMGPLEIPLSADPARPPASSPFPLAAGITRLGFKGQWGVDFDVFVIGETKRQATITGWKHFWHPNPEADQYVAATGKKFEESQYILRLRGTGVFDVLIVPYRSGMRPTDISVVRKSDGVIWLSRGGKLTELAD